MHMFQERILFVVVAVDLLALHFDSIPCEGLRLRVVKLYAKWVGETFGGLQALPWIDLQQRGEKIDSILSRLWVQSAPCSLVDQLTSEPE